MTFVPPVGWSDRLGLAPLDEDLARVEQLMMQQLTTGGDGFLDEVTSYLAAAGGKQLRPILALCGAYAGQRGETLEPVPDAVIVAAAAVEMLHLGSLYHDDVLDEATLRRGVPSVNAQWDNIVAVIGGDILLARAINLTATLGAAAASLLAQTLEAVCAGQADELRFVYDASRDEAAYKRAIAGKTAALMAASLQVGRLVTAADPGSAGTMSTLGREFGMAFQLVDDWLDFADATSMTGKPAGADIRKGIYTLPVIIELRANERLRELLSPTPSAADAEEACLLVAGGAGMVTTADRAREHVARTLALLGKDDLHPAAVQALMRLGDLICQPLSGCAPSPPAAPPAHANGAARANGELLGARAFRSTEWFMDAPSDSAVDESGAPRSPA